MTCNNNNNNNNDDNNNNNSHSSNKKTHRPWVIEAACVSVSSRAALAASSPSPP